MKKYEAIKEFIEELNSDDIVYLWNEYCDKVNYYDDRIYYMYEFDDLFYGKTPLDILDSVSSDFSSNDDYFQFNGYGYAKSFDYPEDRIEVDEVVDFIIENDDSLENDDIRDILDEEDEEDEE